MNSPLDLLFTNQWVFAIFVAAVLISLAEVGYRIGLRLFATKDAARKSQIGAVQGAVLSLLGLLLGFTFSMAVNRFEIRRDLVLKEANTIGTTWLRADLLPEAHRAPVKDFLRRYVDVRLKYERLTENPAIMAEGERASAELETALWQHAAAAAMEAPTPITAAFITTLNEMIDTDAERVTAHRNRIPAAVWILLVLVAASGSLICGYGAGAEGARATLPGVFLPLLIAVVIMLIFDLMHSHQGFIDINQQTMLNLQQAMRSNTP